MSHNKGFFSAGAYYPNGLGAVGSTHKAAPAVAPKKARKAAVKKAPVAAKAVAPKKAAHKGAPTAKEVSKHKSTKGKH